MGTYRVAYVNTLETNLNWHAALLAVMLQEAGGVVELKLTDVEDIDLNSHKVAISYDKDSNKCIVEAIYDES